MRTVAALTMIMAIVVAAIPVENYGTMRAADSQNVADVYTADSSSFSSLYTAANYDGKYNTSDTAKVTIQRVDGNQLIDMFEAQKDTSNGTIAMITKYLGGRSETVEVRADEPGECFGYVYVGASFVQDFHQKYKDKVLKADFSINSNDESVSAPAGSGLPDITLRPELKESNPVYDEKIAVETTETFKNVAFAADTTKKISSQVYINSYFKTDYEKHVERINAYITERNAIKNEAATLTVTDPDLSGKWSRLQERVSTLNRDYPYDELKEFKKSFTGTGNDLTEIDMYIITQNYKEGSKNLQDCDLVRVNYSNGNATCYIPRLRAGASYVDGQKDTEGYLVTDKVNIRGIKSMTDEQGNPAQIKNFTINAPINFIASGAFQGNGYINTLTVNTSGCEIIGDNAFDGCESLMSVSFTDGNGNFKKIGKQAFANTTSLNEITIPGCVTQIGDRAFEKSGLQKVTFGNEKTQDTTVGKYAFYNCGKLETVDFKNGKKFIIGKGAFAFGDTGSNAMKTFVFPNDNNSWDSNDDYILAGRTELEDVTMPGYLNDTIPVNTFKDCQGLKRVYFPDKAFGASYDATTKFDTDGAITDRGLFTDVANPDFYVEGPMTADSPNQIAKCRETTWAATTKYGQGNKGKPVPYMYLDSNKNKHFELGDGDIKDTGEPTYIATVDVTDEGQKLATLSKYTSNGNAPTTDQAIILPGTVGDYTVTTIGKGCFDDKIKNKVYKLTIPDGSIQTIDADAFSNMKNLQWVELGNSVKSIGENAFANCIKLENVVFSQTITSTLEGQTAEAWQEMLTIGENAFNTQSPRLTFHGTINSNYAPFVYAMSDKSASMTSKKIPICYVTDAPLNLTVVRDISEGKPNSGKATLIDYPHYEEIDANPNNELVKEANKDTTTRKLENGNIAETFEKTYVGVDNVTDEMDPWARDIVLQTLNMELPDGIQSIDSVAFFDETKNSDSISAYFNKYYKHDETNKTYKYIDNKATDAKGRKLVTKEDNNVEVQENVTDTAGVKKLYATKVKPEYKYDSYKEYSTHDDKKTDRTPVPGLFSGFFDAVVGLDPTTIPNGAVPTSGLIWRTYDKHRYVENTDTGNDYLTSITMPTVTSLPDYAFDSNENLKEITIGAPMSNIGVRPFRDCKSLWRINTTDSTKYEFENMILYDKASDGSAGYKIVSCLEGRGRTDVTDGDYGTTTINEATNPQFAQVTEIADYAFANNKNVYDIDLSKSNVRKIPEGTFSNCDLLESVELPNTTTVISDYAFAGVNKGHKITVIVPNQACQISQNAFDFDVTGHVTIKGIEFEDEAKGIPSTTYDSYNDLHTVYGDKVDFVPIGRTFTVKFYDADGNLLGDSYEIEKGKDVLNPPIDAAKAAAKTGKKFDKWFCMLANGTVLSGDDAFKNVTEDRNIFAQYADDPKSVTSDGKDYTLTVENGKALVDGSIVSNFPATFKGGTSITVMANDEANFKVWTITPGTYSSLLTSANIYTTSFTMPNDNIVVTANSAIGGGSTGGNTPNPDGTYTVTVNNGTGGGNYRPGATVTITATVPTGQTFTNWTTTTTGVSLANANTATTTFVMPSSNVTVTANFSGNNQGGNTGDNNQGGNNQGGNNQGGNNNATKYKVTVNYGSGSGEYAAGETVNITANAPESSSRVFSRWTTNNSGLGFANANAVSTSFVMPSADVTVTANYKTRTDEDDDEDSPSRRPGTNTNTTTVNNRPGSSTSTTGTGTNGTVNNPANGTTNDNGNRIYITKNGISNTDVASLAVSGSTDNFIVRITESPEATAAVEQALTNTYGSLNGLAYLPMDISLYDSTGQNKITDTTGLNITVTMPIPDVLIQYGGNARVAAADNGNLQQLTPRFTTIDGIACVSFVPPHFSPYVIYVDTNNLIAGQMLDSTPATGDPIHPKWFAAIGMACVSILLFVLSDGRKRRHYRAA